MNNAQIRKEIRQAGIYQYQVADTLGVCEMTFIRWLRKPLSPDVEAKVDAGHRNSAKGGHPMNLPRMRTIPETVAELKEADPHTAITAFAIRRMVKCGEIPHIRAGQKILNNLDKLLEHLSNPTDPVPERDYGRIRPIDARRA